MGNQQPNNPPPPWGTLPGTVGRQQIPGQGTKGVTADTLADGVVPFLASGGATQFLIFAGGAFDPRADGIQLITSQYVPLGKAAWVKQIRVGPYCPPVLVDPWRTSGIAGFVGSWQEFPTSDGQPAAGVNGVWETPMGWLAFHDDERPEPKWEWHLRIIRGDIQELRRKQGDFDPGNHRTWSYLPGLPVPRAAYSGRGLPGASIAMGGHWGPNPMQATPSAPLMTHGLVPENSTVCLFATWEQTPVTPRGADINGTILYGGNDLELGTTVYPLLPSYGQLHGYMQSDGAGASEVNARHGWGG